MNRMDQAITTGLASLLGVVIGGAISYFLQHQQHKQQLALVRENNKTDFVAEETAHHFLSHSKYTDRSFDTLQKHLGGFTDDELRKLLVRAGAIRTIRDDGTEWWRLLERMDEYIKNKKKDRPR